MTRGTRSRSNPDADPDEAHQAEHARDAVEKASGGAAAWGPPAGAVAAVSIAPDVYAALAERILYWTGELPSGLELAFAQAAAAVATRAPVQARADRMENTALRKSRAIGLMTLLTALLGVASCTPELYGYKKIEETAEYVSPVTRKAIVSQGLTRDEVVQQLGQPDGTHEDLSYLSYTRCIKSTGVGVFGPAEVESCQRTEFWFDEHGRAKSQRSSVAECSYGTCDWTAND